MTSGNSKSQNFFGVFRVSSDPKAVLTKLHELSSHRIFTLLEEADNHTILCILYRSCGRMASVKAFQ